MPNIVVHELSLEWSLQLKSLAAKGFHRSVLYLFMTVRHQQLALRKNFAHRSRACTTAKWAVLLLFHTQ